MKQVLSILCNHLTCISQKVGRSNHTNCVETLLQLFEEKCLKNETSRQGWEFDLGDILMLEGQATG